MAPGSGEKDTSPLPFFRLIHFQNRAFGRREFGIKSLRYDLESSDARSVPVERF